VETKTFDVRAMTNNAAFSPDGEWLAVSAQEGISLIATADMTRARLLTYDANGSTADQMTFTPEGTKLVTDIPLKVWDVKTGAEVLTLSPATRPATALAFSPDGTRLAVATEQHVEPNVFGSGDGGKIMLWNLTAGGAPRAVAIHQDEISGVAFTRDGGSIVAGSRGRALAVRSDGQEGELKLWNVASARATRELAKQGWESSSAGVAVSPDGRVLAALVFPFTPHTPDNDGDHISAFTNAEYDTVIRRWDAVSGRAMPDIRVGHGEGAGLAISPNGLRVAALLENEITVWSTATGRLVNRFSVGEHGGTRTASAWLPDSQHLVVAGDRGGLEVRDVLSGELTHDFFEPTARFLAVAADSAGHIAAGDCDGGVRVWDTRDWQPAFARTAHQGCINALAFAPSGQLASAGEDGTVRLWDAGGNWRAVFSTVSNTDQWIVVSPDGRYDGTVSPGRTPVAFRQGRTAWAPDRFLGATRTPKLLPLIAR
jgi:WD40 repeat protein